MKAVRIEAHGGPEVMQLVDVEMPEPRPGEALVRVEACGLNYSDIMIREGLYIDRTPLPYLMGREFCGVVEALGPGATGFAVGSRVVGSVPGGALASHVRAPAMTLMPCPEGLSPAEGASFFIQGITAVHCLEDCTRLREGETVLIHAAAGGVGTLAVQIARAMGAKVLGSASTEEKRKLVAELGATPIDYTSDDWPAKVLEATGGRGADVILESVGGEVFRRSWSEALAIFGRMVVYGVAGGEIVKLDNRDILRSNRSIGGYYLGSYFPKHLDRVARAGAKLTGLIRSGAVRPVVGARYPLDRVVEAFDSLQGRRSTGKVVVEP